MNSFPVRVLRRVLKQKPRGAPSPQIRKRRKAIEAMTITQWLLLTLVIAAGMAAAFAAADYSLKGK